MSQTINGTIEHVESISINQPPIQSVIHKQPVSKLETSCQPKTKRPNNQTTKQPNDQKQPNQTTIKEMEDVSIADQDPKLPPPPPPQQQLQLQLQSLPQSSPTSFETEEGQTPTPLGDCVIDEIKDEGVESPEKANIIYLKSLIQVMAINEAQAQELFQRHVVLLEAVVLSHHYSIQPI